MVQVVPGKEVKKFCEDTSAHGLPRVAAAQNKKQRYAWIILLIICISILIYQIVMIIKKFERHEKIVSVEIIFKAVDFPAVTLCNLNPYKNSLAADVDEVKKTLKAFEKAMTVANPDLKNPHAIDSGSKVKREIQQNKQQNELLNIPKPHRWLVQPVLTSCECSFGLCSPLVNQTPSDANSNLCICIHDSTSDKLWPCSPQDQWEVMECAVCSSVGFCGFPNGQMGDKLALNLNTPCFCSRAHYFCAAVEQTRADIGTLPKLWMESGEDEKSREKRQVMQLQPAYVTCTCETTDNCHPTKDVFKKPGENETTCLCFYNTNSEDQVLWPCYEEHTWQRRNCTACSMVGTCDFVEADVQLESSGEKPAEGGETSNQTEHKVPCLCVDVIKICVKVEQNYKEVTKSAREQSLAALNVTENPAVVVEDKILKFWEITTAPPPEKEVAFEKAQGFTNMTDSVAIVTKAKENLMFAVSKMDESEKSAMSYTSAEFIAKCSFNGRQCEAERDFKLYVDPHYGNCYTFNASLTGNAKCEQSGPSNGLRVELVVDVSDYLPTTEAAGIRLAVHPLAEQPFPDTSGYSAPTGTISSFGIRMKAMDRLPAPFGDCVVDGRNEDYIYKESIYSPEGCQRSCLQKYLVSQCGCGDPKFPNSPNSTNCPADDPDKRVCLKDAVAGVTEGGKVSLECDCRQPCKQTQFTTSYSAATWPAGPNQVSDCPKEMRLKQCVEYFRENKAMVEVFFEELAYEYLLESEAYGVANLLADFGGQLGLWMGVSVITCIELMVFIWGLCIKCCNLCSNKKQSNNSCVYDVVPLDEDVYAMNPPVGEYIVRKREPDYFEPSSRRDDGRKQRRSYKVQSDFF